MSNQHSQDNPDPKNIIPNDKKQKWNATDCAQGLDSYIKIVEAMTKPHQGQEPCPSLKVNIPKDASKPDGDAVENGALLSASELHARSHFVNSPSDTAPILGVKTKDINDEPKDKLYRPPKHSNALDYEAPEYIYTSDGEEVTSETEFGRELVGGDKETSRIGDLF
ncbi:hypothetical protein F5148DRAFT_1282929 [Russula earlei]|uniref:Uncharacterized protein n=1 Tax=Russula earlei TaxID=71964 RepID=A0ACC0UE22_9AGAM|nr:hypothetical protein F5148DRAFT_1282929 [Russula earlei]